MEFFNSHRSYRNSRSPANLQLAEVACYTPHPSPKHTPILTFAGARARGKRGRCIARGRMGRATQGGAKWGGCTQGTRVRRRNLGSSHHFATPIPHRRRIPQVRPLPEKPSHVALLG